MHSAPPDSDPIPPGWHRSPTGRGRPYPAGIVAAVRALVEGTELRFDEIADRTGVGEATVGRWARRGGWRRPDGGEARRTPRYRAGHDVPRCPHAEVLACPAKPMGESRSTRRRRACFETPPGCRPEAPRHDAADKAADRGRPRHAPYGAAEHEAARALIEGSRLGLERIGLQLGIGTATLFRWKKRFRWTRPAPPDRPGPHHYRYRRLRGRPYATDAVETARQLVITTLLPQARIAARAGVTQATVSNWIRRRGWTRPKAKPTSHRFAASRRTAPTVASGDRRGRGYDPQVVAAARELYEQTQLSTVIIAARVKVSAVTVARWAKLKGWTRPRDQPDPHGRLPRRRRGTRRAGLPPFSW